MSDNLATMLTESAERHGDRTALKLDDVELSYELLERASAQAAGLLGEKGFERGDRVALMLPNVPFFPILYYGILRAGGVVVPINPLLKADEVKYHLEDSGSKLLFAWHDFAEAAEKGAGDAGAEVVSVSPDEFQETLQGADPDDAVAGVEADDLAVLLYTSGTTGQPKGSELTHRNARAATDVIAGLVDVNEDDVVLGVLPFFHVFGQNCGLNATVKTGGCLTMIARFDAEKALEVIQRDRVTIFQGVPTMYSAVLNYEGRDQYDTSSIRICIAGGQAMPGDLMSRFEDAFGVEILEGYGLSETSAIATFNHPGQRREGSIGTPVEGVEVKLVDDDGNEVEQGETGEIAVKGPNVMRAYWNREEETKEELVDGWFHTGDMGQQDEDGFVFVVDRKKDIIIRSGENVYPREIEEVLYDHEAVEEAAVIGVEDEEKGEEVAAAVVLREGQDVSVDELRDYVKDKVAGYKYPRLLWFTDELPKGQTGKILKREIEVPEEAKAG